LSQRTIREIAYFIVRSLFTLVRGLPNFSLAGFWWHSFFPGALAQLAERRLDMVPMSRQCDYVTDAFCVDWIYGKNILILSAYAIARGNLFSTPRESFSPSARKGPRLSKAEFVARTALLGGRLAPPDEVARFAPVELLGAKSLRISITLSCSRRSP
jgi:hypothetical protein